MAAVTTSSDRSQSREPLDPQVLAAAVGPRWHVTCVAETGSTNSDLLAAAAAGAAEGVVRVAEHQHGGRGRLDRTWTSPPGAGLTLSLLLRPAVPLARWGWLPLLAGLALHDAVAENAMSMGASAGAAVPLGAAASLGAAGPALKWPNDLLLGPEQRKVAGILVQVSQPAAGGDLGAAAVVGLGVNVSTESAELPVPNATSLAIEGYATDRTALTVSLLAHLDRLYQQWQDADGDVVAVGLLSRYRDACSTIGADVSLELATGAARARALDVDALGRLVVLIDGEGEPRPLTAGDVTHVWPSSR